MLPRLLAYDAWANAESLRSVLAVTPPPAEATRLLAHLAGAGGTWLARLRGTTPRLAIWPELAPTELARELDAVAAGIRDLMNDPESGRLDRIVTYTNSRGDTFTSTVEDILHHVVIHGGYHRGQVAAAVRAAGGTPALTDFIHFARVVQPRTPAPERPRV